MKVLYECTITYTFKKVKFTKSDFNDGRCIKCDAKEVCGFNFSCPCSMNEQLKISKRRIHEDLED